MEHKCYIFGAHSRAQTLAVYLQALYPGWSVAAYLVNNEEENESELDHVPVIRVNRDSDEDQDQNAKLYTEAPLFIATRGIYHKKLTETAMALGFHEIYPVTSALDRKLRNEYLEQYYTGMGRRFEKIDRFGTPDREKQTEVQEKSVCVSSFFRWDGTARIYVAKSIYDAPLREPVELTGYQTILQVGAALTDRRLPDAGALDDSVSFEGVMAGTSDNISFRNRQYCELTGLYWIWKHATEDIVGLEHYRRHFLLPEDWLQRMEQNGMDAILTVPLYVAPSIAGNYRNRHIPEYWDYMLECMKKRDIEECRQAEAFFDQNLYSPCNMFIMRKPVLDDLCSWLFPIIDEVAAYGGECEDAYQNRYPGFLSERLMSFFFEKNRDRYKMVYADKNFLQ